MVLLLGVNIFTLCFLWWKIGRVERAQRRVIGILIQHGWPVKPSDHPNAPKE
jgi:hypothetical protein